MPTYHYKAARPDGEIEQGYLDADSVEAAVARLQSAGWIAIHLSPRTRGGPRLTWRRGPSTSLVEPVARDLSDLLTAGLTLEQALEALRDVAETRDARDMLEHLLERVRSGEALSSAMQAQQAVFTPLQVSLVRAGEAGGQLAAVLEELACYLARSRSLRQEVASSMLYPGILAAVTLVSVFVLLAYVVPRFSGMFEELGGALPLSTWLVINSGELARDFGWLLPLALLLCLGVERRLMTDPDRRLARDAWMLRLPLAGSLVLRTEIARFARTLGTLLRNGVPLVEALRIVSSILGNQALRRGVEDATRRVQTGQGLAASLAACRLFPGLALRMIRVGEESGELGSMLIRVAERYDDEVRTATRRLLALLEPTLIIGMGVAIAIIVLSILMAILETHQLLL